MMKYSVGTLALLGLITLGSINSLYACGCSASNDLKGVENIDSTAGNHSDSSGNAEAHRINPSV